MIKPCGHRVLVKVQQTERKTASGIVLPDSAVEKNQRDQVKGIIVEIGRTAWKAFDDGEPWAVVNDLVLFSRYGGKIVFDDDGTEYRILQDEDVVAIVSEAVNT
jgi:chaperonin GroES